MEAEEESELVEALKALSDSQEEKLVDQLSCQKQIQVSAAGMLVPVDEAKILRSWPLDKLSPGEHDLGQNK